MRVFIGDQEKRSLSVPFVIWRSCRGCSLSEIAGSRVLFLRKQVRDLQVQEFLRELVVGVAAPSDLIGSFIVKILHCGEGRDVEQVARISKQFSRVCDCSSLSLSLNSLMFISCMLISFIVIFLIVTCA